MILHFHKGLLVERTAQVLNPWHAERSCPPRQGCLGCKATWEIKSKQQEFKEQNPRIKGNLYKKSEIHTCHAIIKECCRPSHGPAFLCSSRKRNLWPKYKYSPNAGMAILTCPHLHSVPVGTDSTILALCLPLVCSTAPIQHSCSCSPTDLQAALATA